MNRSLEGRVALVTGASSGIGAATAELLLNRGARVIAAARRTDRLQDVGAAAPEADIFLPIECDVSKEAAVEDLMKQALEWSDGKLDILVNNAGMSRSGPLEGAAASDLRDMLEINVLGLANLTRLALPAIKAAHGDIVNIASIAARAPMAGIAMYAASKAAVSAFSASLRKEVALDGVRILTIYPGIVETEFFDRVSPARKEALEKMIEAVGALKASDVANLIGFALELPSYASLTDVELQPTRQAA